MMSLPLIVGALFLFCGAPGARAATDCDWALALDSHPITAANIMGVKSLLAADTNLGLFFFDLPQSITFDTGQLALANGGAVRVWNLTFLGLPGGAVMAIESAGPPASLPTVSTAKITTLATAAAETPVTTPEASSLLYLGSGLILCGGFWMRRRRF
jgi:hypothetical protein